MNLGNTFSWLAAMIMALAVSAPAADFDMAAFDKANQALKSYQYGGGNIDLDRLEQLVATAARDPQLRPLIEQKLLDTLAAATTNDARQFLCRLLVTIGTARSVAFLEPMLADPEMSHMARYALGRIEAPEASQALHRALAKTSGPLRVGLINTLAQIRYRPAASAIASLASSSDSETAMAAIQALGCLGGAEAISILQKARSSAPSILQRAIDDALLAGAEQCLADGLTGQASALYQEFYSGNYAPHLRLAGLRGLAAARGEQGSALLLEAIQGNDPTLRRAAIHMLALIPGPATTQAFISLLKSLPADGQESVLRALADLAEPSAVPAVIEAAASPNEMVRLAAEEVLGAIGSAEAIPTLASAAASGSPRERQVARASLARLSGPEIDRALIRAMDLVKPGSRVEIIRAVGVRETQAAFPELRRVAQTEADSSVRREAILSLARVAQASGLEVLVELAVSPKDPEDRSVLEQSILILFNKIPNKNQQADPVIAALRNAPDEARPMLLGLLSRPATSEALAMAYFTLDSANPLVSQAALRALGDWPNTAPAERLYQIASGNADPARRRLALRGYLNLAPLSDEPTPLYIKAMQLASRVEEKKLVLGGLGHAGTLPALELAERYLSDNDLKTEASLAAVQVAGQYCWQDPLRARTTLNRIIQEVDNDRIRGEARQTLQRMTSYKDYILAWRGAGPYTLDQVNDGPRVFDAPFAPEIHPDDPSIQWRRIRTVFEGDKRINLEATFGNIDYCCAYLKTTIWSPLDQTATLQWSVDDYIKGWINGQLTTGGLIKLRQGENTFTLKVGDHGGGWNFNCKLTQPDGSPIEGLKYEAR